MELVVIRDLPAHCRQHDLEYNRKRPRVGAGITGTAAATETVIKADKDRIGDNVVDNNYYYLLAAYFSKPWFKWLDLEVIQILRMSLGVLVGMIITLELYLIPDTLT